MYKQNSTPTKIRPDAKSKNKNGPELRVKTYLPEQK